MCRTTENTEKYYRGFGKRLSDRMYDRHVTQSQLSRDLRIPKGTINNWVLGKRLPRAAAMDALCRYLQCSRADLLDDPDGSSPTEELTAEMSHEVFGVQEPAGELVDDNLELALAALDQAGYGRLRALVQAAAGADEKNIDFVVGILRRKPKSK